MLSCRFEAVRYVLTSLVFKIGGIFERGDELSYDFFKNAVLHARTDQFANYILEEEIEMIEPDNCIEAKAAGKMI